MQQRLLIDLANIQCVISRLPDNLKLNAEKEYGRLTVIIVVVIFKIDNKDLPDRNSTFF